ncbi:MAG: hypothetical protein IPN60_11755 [Saprospiraceae bacterium]|nr:hypothetical protein [Candidatus Opimibacter skivensis]
MKTTFQITLFSALLFILPGCSTFFEAEPASDPEAMFDNLWTTFDRDYAVFEERGVNWQQQYDTYRTQVNASTSDDELYNIFTQMLAPLDDGHVTLVAPNKEIWISNTIRREKIDDELFSPNVIKSQYLEVDYETDGSRTSSMEKSRMKTSATSTLPMSDRTFSSSRIFLIRMMMSMGISSTCATMMVETSPIVLVRSEDSSTRERFVFRSKTKNGPGYDDFTEWFDWSIKPASPYVNKPIIVLIDRYTISAGERAVMAFDVLPNVMLVGETTNGGQGTQIGRELANGWFYTLVTQKVELSNGQSYEGIGLAPDVEMKNTQEEINAGVDRVLQFAIEELK